MNTEIDFSRIHEFLCGYLMIGAEQPEYKIFSCRSQKEMRLILNFPINYFFEDSLNKRRLAESPYLDQWSRSSLMYLIHFPLQTALAGRTEVKNEFVAELISQWKEKLTQQRGLLDYLIEKRVQDPAVLLFYGGMTNEGRHGRPNGKPVEVYLFGEREITDTLVDRVINSELTPSRIIDALFSPQNPNCVVFCDEFSYGIEQIGSTRVFDYRYP